MTLLKHCDRVKIACLAQLVNAIVPIRTENTDEGGRCWAQTIFYPFMHCSQYGRGTVLDVRVDCPSYQEANIGEVPYLEACAVLSSENEGEMTIFAVNRSFEEDMDFSCDLSAFGKTDMIEHITMTNEDRMAVNTADDPFQVVPTVIHGAVIKDGILTAKLGKHSWNVIRIR